MAIFYLAMAAFVAVPRNDSFYRDFVAPFYLVLAALFIVTWLTSFTTLADGVLTKRIFLYPLASFPVGEIASIQPHPKNGKWGYGTVFVVWSKDGGKMTLQPNRPEAFLALLREQAPQAEYLL